MRLADYPKLTVIMRGYTFDQADAILQAMQEFDHQFAVEMTMNTKGALENIHELNQRYGDTTYIGAGTVRTPSEGDRMFKEGADIVKVFPAAVVTPRFFKDIQAPLGKLPLMGVGGISKENAKEFFEQGASYLGLGSGMFNKQDIEELNVKNLARSMKELIEVIK